MIRHAMSLDDTISRLKRSNRQPRITQRLADSKKQEKELDDLQVDKLNTKESAEDSDYATSQKHVKRKPTELFYKLKDILAMDAKTLFNIFVEKIPLNGKFQYSCFIVGPYCRLIHTTSDDDNGDKFMTQHMIKHIRTLEKKSAKYPLHYSKKHFYPRLSTSEAMFKKKLPGEEHCNTNGIPAAIRINPPDPESLVDFPLFHESGEQEALLTAVALRRNTNTDVAKPAARKNTRLNRRLITKQKNDIQKKQIEKNLIKHFEKQPKVVMETINIPGLPVIKEEHVTQKEFPQEKK
uniref:Uncharacterized protein n=1 Tax=Ciona savignyi TaxID=51511 RepID=H2YY14_CIOSA